MELKDRIKAARKHAKLTQTQLADRVGVAQASISELERGLSRSSAYLVQIADVCRVNATWLATGAGEMAPSDYYFGASVKKSDEIFTNILIDGGEYLKQQQPPVPLISWVAAGTWHEASDPYAVGAGEEWMPCPVAHGSRTYALRVRGESNFNPYGKRSYSDGDVIYVDPDRIPANGSMVIVRLANSSEATFKELVIGDMGRRYLRPLNPTWPDPVIEVNEDAEFCGVVIGKFVPS